MELEICREKFINLTMLLMALRFAPTDLKFITAGEKDKTLKIWDFEKGVVENEFSNI